MNTIQSLGYWAGPYHAYVPSFGEWGFVLAARTSKPLLWRFPSDLAYVNDVEAASMFKFAKDMSYVQTDVNKLNNQALVRYFEADWSEYVR